LADTSLLENPFRAPMWLDEIRFRLDSGTGWSSMFVELKLGEIPITKGFVPISLMGKALNDSVEPMTSFTWKLPKPLFIPARELLRPTLYFQTYSGASARTVTIIYVCRPLEKGTPAPSLIQLPWVTYYSPPYMASPLIDQTDQSTPSDLYNPFDQDMRIQRFVGRLMVQGSASENDGQMSIASANTNLTTGQITSGTLVSAQDSFNNILIRDRTPFAHVFDFVDRAWTVNCVLPPKGFYLFTVDRLWDNYSASITATVGIGMVGWREVQFRP